MGSGYCVGGGFESQEHHKHSAAAATSEWSVTSESSVTPCRLRGSRFFAMGVPGYRYGCSTPLLASAGVGGDEMGAGTERNV